MSCRYGLGKEEAETHVLCDTIGSIGGNQWRTEGFRVVGDNEKPLLLQSLWKPREGLARRFEIQRRSSVEEKTAKDKDTITAGTVSECSLGELDQFAAYHILNQGVCMSWNKSFFTIQ